MIATVREYDYDEVKERIQKLIDAVRGAQCRQRLENRQLEEPETSKWRLVLNRPTLNDAHVLIQR